VTRAAQGRDRGSEEEDVAEGAGAEEKDVHEQSASLDQARNNNKP
jgi:hypothetical protein